jgi:hypothetical protein
LAEAIGSWLQEEDIPAAPPGWEDLLQRYGFLRAAFVAEFHLVFGSVWRLASNVQGHQNMCPPLRAALSSCAADFIYTLSRTAPAFYGPRPPPPRNWRRGAAL